MNISKRQAIIGGIILVIAIAAGWTYYAQKSNKGKEITTTLTN